MIRFTRAIPLLALAAFCVPAPAQTENGRANWDAIKALPQGTKVRIAPTGPVDVTGKVLAVTEDSILVKSGKGEATVLRANIVWISVRVSRRKKHVASSTTKGAVLGAGVGVAFGLLCTAAIGGDSGPCYVAVPVGAALYAGLGAALGAISPAGEWRQIYHQ